MALEEYYDRLLVVGPLPPFAADNKAYYPTAGAKFHLESSGDSIVFRLVSGESPEDWNGAVFSLQVAANTPLPSTHGGRARSKVFERLYSNFRIGGDFHQIWFIDNGTNLQCIGQAAGAVRESGGYNDGDQGGG